MFQFRLQPSEPSSSQVVEKCVARSCRFVCVWYSCIIVRKNTVFPAKYRPYSVQLWYNCITTGEKMSECVTKNITFSGNIYNAVIYDFFVSRTHHSSHNNKFLSQRNYINWKREHIFICDNFKHSSNCLIIKRAHNYRELATLALNMWNNMYETASHHRDEEVHEYDDTTVLEFHI